ncbi:MAG TPA: iron ABC transporter permease [Ramlibacter sp.]|nr:iron ABC transporter permease [Ramlibacter sp.]
MDIEAGAVRGHGLRARMRTPPPGEALRRAIWGTTLALLALLVVYPVARVCWLAISDPVTDRLATATFVDQITSASTWIAARNTVVMAGASTVLAALFAIPMAWLCTRTDLPGRRQIGGLVFLTFMNPPILFGLAYILIFGPRIGLLTGALAALGVHSTIFSWWGLIFVTTCGSYAIVFMIASAALENLDADLENAAAAHSADPRRTALTVTLPLGLPAIASGCLLSFVLALNAFGVQALIAIPARIPLLTTTIYSYFSYPVQLTAAANQALLLIAISLLVTIAANAYIARHSYATIMGKGLRANRIALSPGAKAAGLAFCILVVGVTIVVPMAVVVLSSFARVHGSFGPSNFTLAGYRSLLNLGDVTGAIENSLVLGLIAAAAMVVIAVSLAYFHRQQTAGCGTAKVVAEIPFVIPGIVLAVGFITAYSRPPLVLYGTAAILVLAYVSKFLPIALRFASNALGQISMELEEGAYTHGASRWLAFSAVLLPLMRRGLAGAAVLSFIFAFNELSASILLISGGRQVTSTVLLHYNEEGLLGALNAFATIIFLVTACAYAIVIRFTGRSVLATTTI